MLIKKIITYCIKHVILRNDYDIINNMIQLYLLIKFNVFNIVL